MSEMRKMEINIPQMSESEREDYHNRFAGIGRLYGQKLYALLPGIHITLIGIGGVGSWSAEALARTGIGELTLIDLDDICMTNTNRQLHTLVDTIGQMKVEVMAERLRKINPLLKINTILDFITKENLSTIIPENTHVIIDAIDSLQNKAALAAHCREHSISLVTIGAAGGKQDPTLVRSGDLSESTQDNLLKRMKKKLRKDYNFPRTEKMDISCVYSTERAVYPGKDGEVCFKDQLEDKTQAKLDCAEGMGTVSFATASFGLAAASEALKLLQKKIHE